MTQRTKRGLRFGAVAIVASAAASQFVAAQNERLTVEVGQCVDLPTPEQRLACFEAQVEAARTPAAVPPAPAAPPAPPAPPADRPAAPAESAAPAASTAEPAARSESEGFGFRQRRRDEPPPAPPPEIRAKIVELRETVPNAFLVTLDNGQVWRQTRPDPYVTMQVGYDVNISFSRFRAYRLTSPDMRGWVQVERVR